jgi:FkbM family methyltransferase
MAVGPWRARLTRQKRRLERSKLRRARLEPGSLVRAAGYTIRINDGPNFRVSYVDIFQREIYRFEPERDPPLVLDCGANIGLSTLFFKRIAPRARIVAFEPDPDVFAVLEENVSRNGLHDVTLVRKAISTATGTASFTSGQRYEGAIVGGLTDSPAPTVEVETVPLAAYLDEPVDFLKMNIEGVECDVLETAGSALRSVREMAIEYHHLPGRPRTLHRILALLDTQGFDYLVSEFGAETNPALSPPFRLTSETKYFLLVYAWRRN